jgi:hypothetical protein
VIALHYFISFLIFYLLLHYFIYFLYFITATKKARKQTGCSNEGSDIPDQTLLPCASCTELVNSDTKCSLCEKPMHVFCSAVELEDGVGDAVCKVCFSKKQMDAANDRELLLFLLLVFFLYVLVDFYFYFSISFILFSCFHF